MKRTAITILCLILILVTKTFAQGQSSTTVSDTSEKKRFSAEWRLSLAGRDNEDEQSQAKYIDLRLEIKSKYLLTSALSLDLQPTLRMVSGQSQSIDGADKMENKILLRQAAVHYTPASFLRMSAGALDQRAMHTSLLMDKIAFPGARVETRIGGNELSSGLMASSSIPTSTSLSTNTKEMEATPALNAAALLLNWTPSKETYWKTSVGYFAYSNLPSAVAQQSMLLGNEVTEETAGHYEFINQFAGLEAGTYLQIPVGTLFDVIASAEYLKNQKAESDVSTAYMYSGGGNIHATANMDLLLTGGFFSVAPEAAVSYFNAHGFETNRTGYFTEGFVSFKKEGFRMGARYTDSEVMFTNTVQSREKSIIIKLETFYANI